MIEIPDAVWDMFAGPAQIVACRAEAWRDGELLAAAVPVASGTLTGDRSLQVPERVDLTVPLEVDGQRWDPIYEDDPLAPYGSRLRVSVGVQVAGRKFVWIPRGEFLITTTDRDGDTLIVQAANLLQLVAEARLVTPLQPKAGDTLKSLARRLVEPAIPVIFDANLADRAVPTSSLQWDDDRIGALYELAAAWPAEVRMHPDGYLLFEPTPLTYDPDAWVADGREAVARQVATTARDGAVNAVVARGTDSAGAQVQGVAYDTMSASPTRYMGPFSPLPVPLFFDSPLLTTVAQCQAAAATLLAKRRRAVARSLTQELGPAAFLELGDLILAHDDRTGDVAVTIETLQLPLTAGDGPMLLGLAVPAA